MNRIRKLKYAAIDGISKGILAFIPGELLGIISGAEAYIVCLISSVICSIASIVVFCILLRKADRIVHFYFLGHLFFALTLFCIVFNYIELHIFIIPGREYGYADGFIIIMAIALYLVVSELTRLIIFISACVDRKLRGKGMPNKTGDGSLS